MSSYFSSYKLLTINLIIALLSFAVLSENYSFADDSNSVTPTDIPLTQANQGNSQSSKTMNTVNTLAESEASAKAAVLDSEQGLVITLYPQHERVNLIESKYFIEFWPDFFGRLGAYVNESSMDELLKQFLSWKRTQDLFANLKALEELKLSLSNHLLGLEHGQDVDSNEVTYKEKLLSLLTRLELQSTHLAKDREWREQEQILKNRLSPLNDLWHADQNLKTKLEPLISKLGEELKALNLELGKLDEKLEQAEEADSVDTPKGEAEFPKQDTQQVLTKAETENKDKSQDEAELLIGKSFDQELEEELLADYYQELKDKTFELESAFGALQIFYKALSSRAERLKKCIESLERLTFDSAKLLRSLPQLKAKNESQLRRVKLWMAYWTSRNQLEHKYESISIESLLSQSTSKQNALKNKWKSLQDLHLELKEKLERFNQQHVESLKTKTPPKIATPQSNSSYIQAKHAHETAQNFLTFHQQRAEQLSTALEQAKLLQKSVEDYSKSLRLSWDLFIEDDVTQVLIMRAKPLDVSHLSTESIIQHSLERSSEIIIKEILSLIDHWEEHTEQLSERSNSWQSNLEDDQKAISRLDAELNGEGGLTHRLELEQTWLAFIKEIEILDGPALLAKHNEALAVYTDQKKQVKLLKKQIKASELEFNKVWTELELMSDPLLRQYKSEAELFETYAQDVITSINKLDPDYKEDSDQKLLGTNVQTGPQSTGNIRESDHKNSPPNSEPTQFVNPAEISTDNTQSQESKLERVQYLAKLFRDRLPPRITHYRQMLFKATQLKELFSKRKGFIENLQGELAKRIEYARQVRRTASVIRQRVLESELPNEAMTEEIENYGQREWVEQLRAEGLEEIQKKLAYDKYKLDQQPQYKSLLTPLESWRDLLNNILDLSSRQIKMISEANQEQNSIFSNAVNTDSKKITSGETKQSLVERQFAHRLKLRMDSDYPWYDFIWSSFNDDQVVDIEDLLKDHYIELLKTEMAQSHLEARIKLTQNLAELVKMQRPLLETYQSQLEIVSKALEQLLESRRLELLMQVDRQKALAQITQQNQSNSMYLDYLALNPLEKKEEREQALGTLEQIWAMHNAYQSALNELEQKLGPQGTLEVISGEVNDAISQLETERDELTRPLLRLLGKRARGADLKQDAPQVGEIDRLHQERIHAKLTVLIRSLLSFLLIPLITLLSLRAINSIERRVKAMSAKDLERLEREGEILTRQKRAEREDRLTTLLQVMKTTSKVLIYTIATGAMLKTLQVDVTPIIASAGIIGLAFAFGAQELVKDFFAGVFILFENQYNKGDFVTINGIFGWIDKITLRLTVIRDSHGVIHFIPNGQVQLVSNHNKEWSQAHLEIGASYNNPPKQVIDCLRKLCMEVESDPIIGEDVLGWEVLGLERFDDSAVVYRVHLRTAPKEKWRVARHYRKRVMEVFAEQNIEIPFPQVVVSHPASSASENERS